MMQDLKVIVVGAGIGGLQTALALAADGHNVTVLESAKAFEEVHFTILSSHLLWPMAHSNWLGRRRHPHPTQLMQAEQLLGRRLQQSQKGDSLRSSLYRLERQGATFRTLRGCRKQIWRTILLPPPSRSGKVTGRDGSSARSN